VRAEQWCDILFQQYNPGTLVCDKHPSTSSVLHIKDKSIALLVVPVFSISYWPGTKSFLDSTTQILLSKYHV
jgi:hypothetical protein